MSQPSFAGLVAANGFSWVIDILRGRRKLHALVVHLSVTGFNFASLISGARCRPRCIGINGDDRSDEDEEAADFEVHDAREVGFG